MDDGVESLQSHTIDRPGGRIPGDVVGLTGAAADESKDLVPLRGEQRTERLADQTGRSCDEHFHCRSVPIAGQELQIPGGHVVAVAKRTIEFPADESPAQQSPDVSQR